MANENTTFAHPPSWPEDNRAFRGLTPRLRQPFQLPAPWPASARDLFSCGGIWLHSGATQENLLARPGPALTSTWNGRTWATHLGDTPCSPGPWSALEEAIRDQQLPWLGAASFELACDEAGLPRQPLESNQLGQHWAPIREALYLGPGGAELWSWTATAPDTAWWTNRLASTRPRRETTLDLQAAWNEAQHRRAVERIQALILDGGFYVANLCVPFEGHLLGEAMDLALTAFQRARPPFGALLDLGGLKLLSLSMERLLSRRGDRIWSQPIKGSVPLTGHAELDEVRARELLADPKERAEHTMILDLVRNDLGRVAQPGTVAVTRPMVVEPFPTVQQLVSTVEARARPGLGLAELLRAVLPGGSVTGAPKHAVCGHLSEAEAGPRGFYCGALGWISAAGDLDLALPIRTAQIRGREVLYWTGGGITRLSQPEREWAELHLKTRAILG